MSKWGKANIDWQQRVDFKRLREERLARAHKMLHKYDIGAAIVFNHDSQRYLSSLMLHAYSRHIPTHFLLLIRDAGFPYASLKEGLDLRPVEDCPWLEGRLVSEDVLSQPGVIRMRSDADFEKRWKKTVQQIKSLLKEHGVANLPVSVDYTSPHMMKALMDAGFTVVDGNNWILEADVVKTDDEIELMKIAASCNEAGYSAIVREFRPGMTEYDAMAIMAKGIFSAGADHIVGWVVNSGPRAAPRSFDYTDRIVRPGELMGLEAIVTYLGYGVCYDRTFLVGGKPTEIQKELYDTNVEFQHTVKELLKPGASSHEIIKRVQGKVPLLAGFKSLTDLRAHRATATATYQNHFGGMGIRYDDSPTCTLDEPEIVMEKNMCVAYHLCYYFEGYEGVSMESTWRVTDTGCENLCKWPFEELMVIGSC